MRRLFKGFAITVLVTVLIGAIVSAPTVYKGYQLYRSVVKETAIAEKVAEIKRSVNYVELDDISDYFKDEIIKSEDKRFWFHFGIDPLAIIRAIKNDILAGSFVEGGSTITQQLAKNMYFDFDKNFERKVAEVFVAFHLEKDYSKDEILEMYLNCIYFGENCYGIKEAANHYYGAVPETISKSQADSLVITIKCPNLYNPNERNAA
ncbi:Monofunctional glycosyltransferase [uncultured Eubacterium sp.]|uniref:biosynthetic peptidoglycan transglycosylase n=1 Tax=Emergencia sp. TaxID=1926557 RepID=UPI0008225AA4|nr:Monofunctional glycosyltransferase [uncultured Eubacterium sp.]